MSTPHPCVYCGCDASLRKGLRDKDGHVFCAPCYIEYAQKHSLPIPQVVRDAARDALAHPSPAPRASLAPSSQTDDPAHIPRPDDPLENRVPGEASTQLPYAPGSDPDPVKARERVRKHIADTLNLDASDLHLDRDPDRPFAPPEGGPCPKCGTPFAGTEILCTSCGFNTVTGKSIQTKLHKGVYHLPPDNAEALRREKLERAAARRPYVVPALIAAITLAVTSALVSDRFGNAGLAAYLVGFTFRFIVGFVAYLIAARLWMGMNSPIRLLAARLAAIFAVFSTILFYLRASGVPMIATTAIFLVMLFIVCDQWLDMDPQDAILYTAIIVVLNYMITIAVLSMIL